MSGAGSSTKLGLRQEEYSPLIDSSSKRNSHETPSSPQRTTNGSSVPRRTSRSTSRGFQTSIRSVSRAGTGNGEVLEVHFASVEQKRIKWWKDAAITGLFILSWFLFATILSVYNKWMFSIKYLGFPFPLFVTTLHMIVQWGLAAAVRRLWPARFKPDVNPSKKDYATKAVPTAVATSLDIGLSNLSLKLITLSFYTMCKSSSLIFVLLFAFLLRLEKPSLRLIFVILLITAGVLLMVFTTTSFSLGGLILVLSASFLGGLRWGLTQILLKKRDMGMNNPAATVFWLAPSMAVTLSITSMAVEGWIRVWNDPFWERVGIFKSLFYLISPGFIAFAMVMSEY
ncbi:Triose-phosphate Transporter [Serendipita sp. 397]|nr:Triose-phosphate Transporter [Serendipita sp. 397]